VTDNYLLFFCLKNKLNHFKTKKNAMSKQVNLSKGCQACQTGKWVCIYLTYLCQAECSFCPSPYNDDRVWTEYGDQMENVAAILEKGIHSGVGFSGGECFLVPQRLEKWQRYLHKRFPTLYYWVYTNGMAAFPDVMSRIAGLGINEIRFNIAAFGYDNQKVIDHIRAAVKIFNNVAIEIPSIPLHYTNITKILPLYAQIGVKFLNLHEFILNQKDPLAKIANQNTCQFNILGQLVFDKDSKKNTQKIKNFCLKQKLPFIINDCSITKKEIQMKHRRINNANKFCQPWERVTKNGLLETYYRIDKISKLIDDPSRFDTNFTAHPDTTYSLKKYQLITFMPPMDIYSKRKLIL